MPGSFRKDARLLEVSSFSFAAPRPRPMSGCSPIASWTTRWDWPTRGGLRRRSFYMRLRARESVGFDCRQRESS